MKKLTIVSIVTISLLICTTLYAQKNAPLGKGNLAVKFDYIAFTDDFFKNPPDPTLEENNASAYVGLEGYGKVVSNLYLGGEIGYSYLSLGEELSFSDHRDLDIAIIFMELNLKYAKDLGHNFVIDLGAGLSFNNTQVTFKTYDFGLFNGVWTSTLTDKREVSDWLLGGQIFADLTYKIRWFSIGINGKYQLTESFRDSTSSYNFDLSNWRLGMQFGIIF